MREEAAYRMEGD